MIAGMAFSVWDYKQWRGEEMRNFGQGPSSNPKSQIPNPKLAEVYQDDEWGIRFKYPVGWKIEENLKIEKTEKNLPDLVDDEVARLGKLDREPDHVSTDIIVLTKDGNQTALTKKGDIYIKIASLTEGLAGEMAKSLVFF